MNSSENETLRNVARPRGDLQNKMVSLRIGAAAQTAFSNGGAVEAGTPVATTPLELLQRGYAMTQIRKLFTATATFATVATAAVFAQGAFAQTAAQAGGEAPTMAPSAAPAMAPGAAPAQAAMPGQMSGQMAGQAPAAAGVAQPATPQSTDPLVQKRNANAAANAEYRSAKKSANAEYSDAKKQAKSQYKSQVKDAKIIHKADRQANDSEMKDQMNGMSAQQQSGQVQQ
jgi:hypothetical protein